jgi:succinate dehydrogenase / fumarate reductase cytochrome b subunit
MLGGIRHLIWDTGRGLQIWQVNVLSWLTIVGSVTLTLALWAVGLASRGGL